VFSVQSGFVKLYLCACPTGIQGSGSSAPPLPPGPLHTLKHSTTRTVNGHEWSAASQATPMPTEQKAGWETELA